jgi:hypothetical protein
MSSILTKWWFISHLLLLTSLASSGQVVQSARFEIPFSRNDTKFEIIPADQYGLFLLRRLGGFPDDQLEIAKLDTSFHESWHGYLAIDKKFLLVGKRTEKQKLYLLLRYMDFSKNDLELISIDQESGNFVRHMVKNFIPFSPSEFQITQNGALIGGYYNRVPVVIFFSFGTQKSRILPGLLNESGELTQIKTYPDGSFDVLISGRGYKGQKTIWIKNYDANADLITNYALESEDNKHLIFARSLKTHENMQVVAGVFGTRNSEYARGLFIATVDPAGLQRMRYYYFADLQNFFKYMKAKREQRIKARIERKRIKGKRARFNYRFMVHELVPYNNQYVLLGEAFYPKYTSVDSRSYNGFFSPGFSQGAYIRNGRIFDGYYYTHAVVIGFDNDGNIRWDNSFEINDVKTFTLEQFVKLEVQEDKIALLYLFDNELRTKIIKDDQVLEGKSSEPIKTTLENEVIKKENTDVSKLDYWYKDYFYAFGVQEVTNPLAGKRRVFFINKLSYE